MIRKLLIASTVVVAFGSAAYAADLPTTKGPAVYTPPPAIFTWTGLYAGAQVGYQWGRTYTSTPQLGGFTFPAYTDDGVIGGGHIGYNYQTGYFVLGVEGDVNGSSYRGQNTVPFGGLVTYGSKEPLNASLRGRLGYAWDRALIYGTGGVAFGDFNNFEHATTGPATNYSNWNTRVGWTVGGGIDYAIDNNWSVGLEYRYTSFGAYSYALVPARFAITDRVRQYDNRVQAEFSYKFDWAQPIVSKY